MEIYYHTLFIKLLENFSKEGFVRARVDGEIVELTDDLEAQIALEQVEFYDFCFCCLFVPRYHERFYEFYT